MYIPCLALPIYLTYVDGCALLLRFFFLVDLGWENTFYSSISYSAVGLLVVCSDHHQHHHHLARQV